jgi:Zn-dependent protease/CBS domain-containing protein
MFGRRVTLFTLSGFDVRVDASWIILAALITWSLATGIFPHEYPGLAASNYWWMGIAGALGLFLSIVVHEFFHSFVARHYDLPMKGITLFVFGGVAEMGGEPQSAKVEFLIAIAGPIASVLIGFVFWALRYAGQNRWPTEAIGVVAYLSWINWILAAFNLVPAFPLDGGRVLRSALWYFMGNLTRATRIASSIGAALGLLLMAYGIFQFLMGNIIGGIWYFVIAMFLRQAAQMSYQQLVLRRALQGEPVSRFMNSDPVTVPRAISIRDFVENYFYRYHFKFFPVINENQQLTGCVTPRKVREIPPDEWERHTVGEVIDACSADNTIAPDADALDALSKMQKTNSSRLMVTDHGRLLAIVSLKDLLRFLAAKVELGEGGKALPHGPH